MVGCYCRSAVWWQGSRDDPGSFAHWAASENASWTSASWADGSVGKQTQGGAREDSTRIGKGGAVRRQAVDVSPLRRIQIALYLMHKGATEAAFRSLKSIQECMADEIINASKGPGSNSYALRKKDEIERVAKGNR